jgi:hypothetical protein
MVLYLESAEILCRSTGIFYHPVVAEIHCLAQLQQQCLLRPSLLPSYLQSWPQQRDLASVLASLGLVVRHVEAAGIELRCVQ